MGLGIVVYAFLKNFSSVASRIPDEILKTPTPVFISTALVLALWALKLLFLQGIALINTPRRPRDLVYRDLEYFWIYSLDGSLQGTCVYELENRSNTEIDALPYEALVWFQSVEKKDVAFRIIYRDGDVPHHFEDADSRWIPLPDFIEALRGRVASDLSWSPKIIPPIAPGETILYEVEIGTPRTERDAFKSQGTILGFPVRRYTNQVRLSARAPRGRKFTLMAPSTNVLDIVTGQNEPELEASLPIPTVSADGSRLTWQIEFPRVGYRYWINYKFDKKS